MSQDVLYCTEPYILLFYHAHPDGTTNEQPCAAHLSLFSFLHAPKNEVCTFEQTANQGVKVYLKCRHLIPRQSLLLEYLIAILSIFYRGGGSNQRKLLKWGKIISFFLQRYLTKLSIVSTKVNLTFRSYANIKNTRYMPEVSRNIMKLLPLS